MQDTGNRTYRLLCLDLDGTLLTDEKEISREDIAVIRQMEQEGTSIALVTGRMPAATEGIVRKLGIPCILACDAGTYIEENDVCISSEYLPREAMEAVYQVVEQHHIPLWIFRHKDWMVTRVDEVVEEEIRTIQYTPKVVVLEELLEDWKRKEICPNKLLVGASPELVQKIYTQLREMRIKGIDMACSSENFLEIFPTGMNKGRALRLICEKKGIAREETIAIGDQELDVSMIEEAGLGIAMENGIEEIKKKADFVTRTNNEAGIAYALKTLLAGREENRK